MCVTKPSDGTTSNVSSKHAHTAWLYASTQKNGVRERERVEERKGKEETEYIYVCVCVCVCL